jgi:uncharacterized protein (DUF2336 family)
MTEAFSIEALMESARDRSPEGRSRLFGLLGQLFLARGQGLSDGESRGFIELLEILKSSATVEARLELAYATANAPFAPGGLAKLLAEDDIEIASLVLFQAESLGAADLLALAEDPERATIIAARRALPMMVADSLMRRADPDLARVLLKNETIKLSIPAMADAIEMARDDLDLQQRIAKRPELMEEAGIEMSEWADPTVREQLIERFELAPASGDTIARLRNLLSLAVESGAPQQPDFTGATPVRTEIDAAPEPQDSGAPLPDPRFRLSPRLMVETLRRGERAMAEAMFAKMADLPMALVQHFVKENNGESIAVAARAIGMAREEFATIYLLWRKAQSQDGLVAAGALGGALDLFDTIPQDRVEVEISHWRRTAQAAAAEGTGTA